MREGERYARRYYGKRYRQVAKEFDLKHLRELIAAVRKRQEPYRRSGQITSRAEKPSVTAVKALLAQGWTVIVELYPTEEDMPHVGLLLPREDYPNGSAVWLYNPQENGKTLHQKSLASAMRSIDLEAFGFIGVRVS